MTTYIHSKKEFINELNRLIGDDKIIVSSDSFDGTSYAPTKSRPNYRISMGLSPKAFTEKSSNGLSVIESNRRILLVIIDKEDASAEALELIRKRKTPETSS